MKRFALDAIRYALAILMTPYALYKIMGIQCTVLPFSAWQYPLESLRSDQVMWAFLGSSYGLQLFLGLAEMIPCCLLFFRRTALAGALLMLPVAVGVTAVNFGADLWGYTKALSAIVLTLNIALLLLHRDVLLQIYRIIFPLQPRPAKPARLRFIAALCILVVFSIYKANTMFFDRSMTNLLTGDWPSRHPYEWVLANETIGDATLPLRNIRMYFMPRNMYAEINDNTLNRGSSRYYLDTGSGTLNFSRFWDGTNKNDKYLMDGTFSYKINADTLLLQNIGSSGTLHKMCFKRRTINSSK